VTPDASGFAVRVSPDRCGTCSSDENDAWSGGRGGQHEIKIGADADSGVREFLRE